MKFVVKCLVSSVTSSEIPEADAMIKEIEVNNPKATLQNLRAAAAVSFRINVYGFRMVAADSSVDLTDEKKLLTECGLQDGCEVTLISKHAHPSTATAAATGCPSAAVTNVRPSSEADDQPLLKSSRLDGADAAGDQEGEGSEHGEEEEEDHEDHDASLPDDIGDVENDSADDELGEGDAALAALAANNGAGELYGRLLEVVPNLVEMREQFLADPAAVMQRIQREDPSLFQLISAQQEAFIDLVNNEHLVRTLQEERDAEAEFVGDYDEEMDEETEQAMSEMLLSYLGGGELPEGLLDIEGGEANPDAPDGEGGLGFLGGNEEDERKRILDFAPSEEDEKKIQELVQLGFTYDQCKIAFYQCRRSLDRAANMLFENPPKL